MRENARVTAVLGPTNTGKTHYAIERMLAHRTGVIGLPLRLLAREVYDRIVAARGPSVVALVTGEERIVPERTAYWVSTVEAMPQEIGADFVAVDEIQLCADPERGHVFTDRLLRARGLHETLFLGSDTMRAAIAALVPNVTFITRPRLSELTWAGSKKLSRMPERAAIVGFSVETVYAIAELIRRQKGGCAVVMGALSPRTRNAQVALYQNGDVDYLVATDAIGMGLNLDIRHVAFSSTAKFDGRRMRGLYPQELAQIAGRAGRHTAPGTFGVTGEARPLDEETIEAIESHRFLPVRKLHWRNEALDFGSVPRLIASLERQTTNEWLTRSRDGDDLTALKTLADNPEVRAALTTPAQVRLLWDICRIPDFRGISPAEHAGLLARLFDFMKDGRPVPDDWLARNIARIDRTDGDIDAIMKRLAYIRTWTYVAQRRGWTGDESHWREETRAVEDRLSDALHARLTQRFVDRRTSVLMRRLKMKESLVAEVNNDGGVTVEGEFVGRLEGFRFRMDKAGSPDEARTLRQAATEALRPEFTLRADRFYNAPDTEFDYTEQGGLMWGTTAVGKLVRGADALKPGVEAFVDEEAGEAVAEKVRRRLQHFIDRKVSALFEPLHALSRDEALTGLARGFAFRLVEAMGVLPREGVAEEVKALDQDARGALRKHGIRFGQYTIFLPALLKPAPTRLRMVLWSLWQGIEEFPESPPPGLVTIPNLAVVPPGHYTLAGYHPAGTRAIRIDMLERLADMIRTRDSRAGFEAAPEMLSITGLSLAQFADLMGGLGYRADKGERPKSRPEARPAAAPADAAAAAALPEAAAEDAAEAAPVAGAAPEPAFDLPEPGATAPAEAAADVPAEAPAAPAETEAFYTFVWAPRPRGPRREGGPRAGASRDGNQPRRDGGRPRGGQPGRGRPPAAAEGAAPVAAADAPVSAEAPRPDAPPREDRRGGDHRGRGDRQRDLARDEKREGGKDGHRDGQKDGHRDGNRDRNHDGKPGGFRDGKRDGHQGGKQGAKPGGGNAGGKHGGPLRAEARPPREAGKYDPDSPFAILAALRDRT